LDFDWIMAGIASGEIDRIAQRCRIYEEALLRIRNEEGKVCDDFDRCDHASCRSSYNAWLIADQALR
jgi:hypothetical protein